MPSAQITPTVAPAPVMTDDDFPGLYLSADSTSVKGRDTTFGQTRWYLGALTVGALAGAVTWDVGDHDLMGWLSVVAFLLSLALALLLAVRRPAESWYQGRAAAESVKSLTWCYVSGADPFPVGAPDADENFVGRLRQVVRQLSDLDAAANTGAQITDRMRNLRATSFEERRRAYVIGRIEDQRTWYAQKATFHRSRARQLIAGAVGSSLIALVLGVLRALEVISTDLLGVFAAVGAALVAESQLRQHTINSSAYTLACQELGLVSAVAENATEADWPRLVNESEEAISREHTMWCARNGISGSSGSPSS